MARSDILLTNRHFQELNPLIAGEEFCEPNHSFGPAVRKYTLIHYVVSGKGTLYSRGGTHTVSAGQAFLILEKVMARRLRCRFPRRTAARHRTDRPRR